MTILEPFLDSEKGAKAAWKGFASQTLYIANRLMLLYDDSQFYPEKLEDLLVYKNGIVVESIQVKNIATDLTLSQFSPKSPDSFFKRSLSLRQENNDLKLLVVSFGPLGKELIEVKAKNTSAIKGVLNRLIEYGYSPADAEWVLSRLEIQTADYAQLEKQIFNELTKITETMAAPDLAFDVLINYISTLSRKGEKTSKLEWTLKLHNIATDFAAMSGFQQEYGRSIRPLFEYKSDLTLEKLREGYKMGINAHPDHIRNELDLKRERWIERIKNGFEYNQIVILRGASGQGKSSLAYRYLIDTYPESNVFLIEQVENISQAANIVAAMSNLSVARDNNLIAYIDVAPYQQDWLWVIEQLQKTGVNIKLLITIREEDYRRAVVDKSNISFNDIELVFDKSEAEWVYSQQSTKRFRNFEEAWLRFGESGPLMEFIYLLNEISTLKQKLEAQINKIRMEEPEAQTWLSVLRLSAYAGRLNINLNLRKVIQATDCKSYDKMIYLFEKEYLLRTIENKIYIEPLHAIRAEIIYSILKDLALYPEEELLLKAIKCVDEHSQMLIVNHCYLNPYSVALVEKIAALSFDKWSNYASAVSGMLWLEVYHLYQLNRDILLEGDRESNNSFSFIALADVSGLLGEIDLSSFFEIMKSMNPQGLERFKKIADEIPQKHLGYGYADKFLEMSRGHLPSYLPDKNPEISDLGFVLFWLSVRGFLIAPLFDAKEVMQLIEVVDIDNILDLMEGIHYQKWHEVYNEILPALRDALCSKLRIVILEERDDGISVQFIANVFDANTKSKDFSAHTQTMAVIKALRKLYPDKQRYAVKILGADFIDGIPALDGEKNIESRYLPSEYITQLNRWFHNLNVYEHRAGTWNEYTENIIDIRNSIADSAEALLVGIDYLYKKDGIIKKLVTEDFLKLMTETERKLSNYNGVLPKCAMDRFGFGGESNSTDKVDDNIDDAQNNSMTQVLQNFQSAKTAFFRTVFREYCNNYLNFLKHKDALLISRTNRVEIDQTERLSLLNLIEAVSQIKVVQREFEELFSDLIDPNKLSQLHTKEDERLELLLSVWNFLLETELRKIDSLVYGQKFLLRRRKSDIEVFFQKKLETLVGVSFISTPILRTGGDINLYISVDFAKIDAFLKTLYKEFKNSFPNARSLTFEGLSILNYVHQIIVCPLIGNYQMTGAMNIKVRNLMNFDEEKFMKYILPYEPDAYMKNNFNIPSDGNPILHWSLLLSSAITLKLLLSHADKTIHAIFSMPPNTNVEDKVFFEWCDDGIDLLSKIMDQAAADFQLLADILHQMPGASKHLDVLGQTIRTLEENKEMFIKSPDKDHFLGLLGNLNINLEHLFLYIAK